MEAQKGRKTVCEVSRGGFLWHVGADSVWVFGFISVISFFWLKDNSRDGGTMRFGNKLGSLLYLVKIIVIWMLLSVFKLIY
jgi:hypothetical protein